MSWTRLSSHVIWTTTAFACTRIRPFLFLIMTNLMTLPMELELGLRSTALRDYHTTYPRSRGHHGDDGYGEEKAGRLPEMSPMR